MAKGKKGKENERQEYKERFPIEVSASAPVPVDKRSLPKELQGKVFFGGTHSSIFRGEMERDAENTREIRVTFPTEFQLDKKQQ